MAILAMELALRLDGATDSLRARLVDGRGQQQNLIDEEAIDVLVARLGAGACKSLGLRFEPLRDLEIQSRHSLAFGSGIEFSFAASPQEAVQLLGEPFGGPLEEHLEVKDKLPGCG